MLTIFNEVCIMLLGSPASRLPCPQVSLWIECLESCRAIRPSHESDENILAIMKQAVHLVMQRRRSLLDRSLTEVE